MALRDFERSSGDVAKAKLETSVSPVDLAVLSGIQSAESQGRGWVLDTMKDLDGNFVVAVKQTLPPDDEYQRKADGRRHLIGDVESMILFAKRYGDEKKSLLMICDDKAVLVLDEEIDRGEREIVTLGFGQTPEFQAWDGIVGRPIGHKKMLAFLITHLHTMESPELLETMRKATVNASIDTTSDLRDDAKTIGVMVSTRAGEELLKFPKEINIHVPVLQEDVLEETDWMRTKVRLNIDLPTNAEDNIAFTLICSEWPMLVRKRTQRIVETLRESLSGWTIVRGSHSTFARCFGAPARPKADS